MIRLFKTPYSARWFFPRRIWGFSSSDSVYLTFDDGPTPEMTRWILNLLEEKGVVATFFCVGANAVKHPDLMEELIRKGHSIGNHTMCHEKGTKVSREEYLNSINEASTHIPSLLFRPPYGRIKKAWEKDLYPNYKIVMWSWLSYDFDQSIPLDRILKKAEKQVKAGDILVLHDNAKVEERVKRLLPQLIDIIKDKGLKFATISA